jgi:hypothetical protein
LLCIYKKVTEYLCRGAGGCGSVSGLPLDKDLDGARDTLVDEACGLW